MAEAGHGSVEVVSWAAAFVPARTDPAIVERLNQEINQVLARPETKERLKSMGAMPMPTTPDGLRSFVTSEIAR
jgi:tripartite-type tricarboxylate transporter receptor subunit TctC